MSKATKTQQLFDKLTEWGNLPKYQLERRADIFFAVHLSDILKAEHPDKPDIDAIIPEFPLRKRPKCSSNNVDYLCVNKKTNTMYLVELKTDMASLNMKQNDYLRKGLNLSFRELVDDIIEIMKSSSCRKEAKVKYHELLHYLNELELLTLENKESFWRGRIEHVKRNVKCENLKWGKKKCIFIQPTTTYDKIKKAERASVEEFQRNECDVIDFNCVARVLAEISSQDELTAAFCETVPKWIR